MKNTVKAKEIVQQTPKPKMEITNGQVVICGDRWATYFDQKSGSLVQYQCNGQELIHSPLVPNLWRVRIDNEISGQILYTWARPFYQTSILAGSNPKSTKSGFENSG